MFKKIIETTKDKWTNRSIGARKPKLRTDDQVLKMCIKCYAFNYSGGWHIERPEYLVESDVDEKITVKFSQCPACVEESLAVYDVEYAEYA